MGQFNKKLEEHPFYVFDETEAALGWAYDVDEGICGCRPDDEFFDYLEFAYVKAIHNEDYASGFLFLEDKLYPCFTWWIGNFIDDWDCFHFISRAIIDRYEREEKIDRSVAVVNLKKSLRITLKTVFNYIDENIIANFREEELYAKYLISYLKLRSFFIDENHLLYSFKEDVLKELLLRKDIYQELVTFNKISKHQKLTYMSFKIQLDENQIRNSIRDRSKPKTFLELWSIEENEVYNVLDDFIKKSPEEYIQKREGIYFYIVQSGNKSNKRLAGLIVAIYKAGWINLNLVEHDAPKFIDLLNNFFQIEIKDKTPFTNSKLANMRDDKHADYASFVKPLMPFIKTRNRI